MLTKGSVISQQSAFAWVLGIALLTEGFGAGATWAGENTETESLEGSEHQRGEVTKGKQRRDTRMERRAARLVDRWSFSAALELYEAMLEFRSRSLGPAHPDTLHIANELAHLYVTRDEFEKTEPSDQREFMAIERILEAEHPPDDLSVLDVFLIDPSPYAKVEPLYQRALDSCEHTLGPKHPDTLSSLANLAVIYDKQGRYVEAEPLYLRALEGLESTLGSEHPDTLFAEANLASLYVKQGRYIEAEPLYLHALEGRERTLGSEHPDVLISMQALAFFYLNSSRDAEAEPLFLRALRTSERILVPDSPNTITYLTTLAALYEEQDQHTAAESLYLRAIAAEKRTFGPKHLNTLDTAYKLALLYYAQGRYAEAEPIYKEVKKAKERILGPEDPYALSSVANLASLYEKQGRYTEAERLYLRALEGLESTLGPEHPDTLSSVNNLALLYQKQGRYTEAEPLNLRYLEVRERTKGLEHPYTLTAVHNLSALYRAQGRYAEAEPLLLRAYKGWERILGPEDPQTLISVGNLAGLYKSQGRDTEAESFYLRALEGHERRLGAEHPITLTSVTNLGIFFLEQGRYTEAEPHILRALEAHERTLGPRHPKTLTTVQALAMLYRKEGRLAEAEPLYLRALDAQEHTLGPDHPATLNSLMSLAGFYREQERYSEALTLALRLANGQETHLRSNFTGSERARQAFFDTFRRSTDFILSLHLDHATDLEAAQDLAFETWLRRRGRVLDVQSSTLSTLRRSLDDEGLALLENLRRLRIRQAYLVNNVSEEDLEAYHQQVTDLASLIQDTEYAIAAKSEQFRIETQPVTIEVVQQHLPSRSALLLYAVYTPIGGNDDVNADRAPHLAAYILFADGQVQGMKLGPMAEFEGRLSAFRQTQNASLATWLRSRLVAPLLPDPASLDHLFISPDGPLNLIPFEALLDEQGSPLLDAVNVSYLSTGRDLLRLGHQESVELHSPMVLADPDYGPGKWKTLPGTRTEAVVLQELYPTAIVHVGTEATVESLRDIDSPMFLHVATHGFIDEDDPHSLADNNPMTRSGLLLAGANEEHRKDTRLLASEVATLDLDGTKLVVLSACESGLGQAENGEGVYGMRRALALAGSESQLVSLWPVDDEATAVFMQGFYKRMKDGEPLAQALRHTKESMRESEVWNDPMYWSPFVLAGEWR